MKVYCVFMSDGGVSDHDRLEGICATKDIAESFLLIHEKWLKNDPWNYRCKLYIEEKEVIGCSD